MRYIKSSEAAKIAGVSRQAINDLFKKGNHNFFVNLQIDGKTCLRVDIESMSWNEYLQDKKSNKEKPVISRAEKIEKNKPKSKIENESSNKNPDIILNDYNRSHGEYYIKELPVIDKNRILSLADQQKIATIRIKQLEYEERISNLVDKKIIESKMGLLYTAVKANFVDYAKNISALICAKLDCVGMEKIVETIIGGDMEHRIDNVLQAVIAVRDIKNE